jgi:hypothetical protein
MGAATVTSQQEYFEDPGIVTSNLPGIDKILFCDDKAGYQNIKF